MEESEDNNGAILEETVEIVCFGPEIIVPGYHRQGFPKEILSNTVTQFIANKAAMEAMWDQAPELLTLLPPNRGISDNLYIQIPLFILFLLIYLTTLIGNLMIFIVICQDHHLHKPMYFFLCNLACLDMFYASVIQPKLLSIHLMGSHAISFTGCIIQLFLYTSSVATEFFLITIMGYDRFVAICKPFQYMHLMNNKVCVLLATICWVSGLLEPVTHTIVMSQLPYCKPDINHFYCDYSALLKLSCVDTITIEVMTIFAAIVVGCPAFLLTLASYVYIISTVMKMRSSQGKWKTFATCVPHLTVIIIYYCTAVIMHVKPTANNSSIEDKIISVLYTILIPMVNPFIFTLRNKEVKQSFSRTVKK
ncbi:olfactory receptor 6M1-like [Discoglossus pictus]